MTEKKEEVNFTGLQMFKSFEIYFFKIQACKESSVNIYAYPNNLFILDCATSNIGLGLVLSKVVYGPEKVKGYYSKTFSKTENIIVLQVGNRYLRFTFNELF